MTIGTSLILLAVGAILRYAVADSWDAVDLTTVGLILMIVGAVGGVIGLAQWASLSSEQRRRETERQAEPPRDAR